MRDVAAEGVTITVTDADGNEVGVGATDADGVFLLEVPGPGGSALLLDESTLPEGSGRCVPPTGIRQPSNVSTGQQGRVLFATRRRRCSSPAMPAAA